VPGPLGLAILDEALGQLQFAGRVLLQLVGVVLGLGLVLGLVLRLVLGLGLVLGLRLVLRLLPLGVAALLADFDENVAVVGVLLGVFGAPQHGRSHHEQGASDEHTAHGSSSNRVQDRESRGASTAGKLRTSYHEVSLKRNENGSAESANGRRANGPNLL